MRTTSQQVPVVGPLSLALNLGDIFHSINLKLNYIMLISDILYLTYFSKHYLSGVIIILLLKWLSAAFISMFTYMLVTFEF